jgi:hypothetical protein
MVTTAAVIVKASTDVSKRSGSLNISCTHQYHWSNTPTIALRESTVATSFFRITQVLFLSLMTLIFVGMGLIRAAELGIVK